MVEEYSSHLRHGDKKKIAKELGVTPHMVSRVAQGLNKSATIERALTALNAERKKQEEESIRRLCDSIKSESINDLR